MEQEVCDLKHVSIDKHSELVDKRLDNHSKRLDKLEIGQTATNTRMDNVCDKLDKLVDAIYDVLKSTVGFVIVTGVLFIIWYIQGL